MGCARLAPFHAVEPLPEPASLADATADSDVVRPPSIASHDDYIVRVVTGSVTCSGTLIGDNQVLTAHHCIAERDAAGDIISKDVSAERVRVELGGDDFPYADGEMRVRAIVAPPCGYATGEGDIAVLVLDKKLSSRHFPSVQPVLDRAPHVGEEVDPSGFGRCALSSDPIRLKHRAGGRIKNVMSTRYRLTASICPGDSGGPALNAKGELLGVVSASVMDGNENTLGESEFTRVDSWLPVFSNAKYIAEGLNPAELPPIDCPAQ